MERCLINAYNNCESKVSKIPEAICGVVELKLEARFVLKKTFKLLLYLTMLMNWTNEFFIIAFTFELQFSYLSTKTVCFHKTVAGSGLWARGAVLSCSADKFPVLLRDKNAPTFCINFSPYGHCYPACEIAGISLLRIRHIHSFMVVS